MALERLQKILAAAGCGSRRACETFIAEGRVEVDHQPVTTAGTRVDPSQCEIRLDGELVRLPKRRTWLLNKPRGVICSARGRPDLPMVNDFAPPEAANQRLFSVGRLDVESQGAILLTNDGELCHLVSHPRFGVEKTYRAHVRGVPSDETIEAMRKGIWLAEGRTGPLRIRALSRRRDRAVLELKVREGMKREIRRVCARFGHEVQRLERTAIGPIELGQLALGDTRPLTAAEESALRASATAVIRLGGRPVSKPGSAKERRSRARAPGTVYGKQPGGARSKSHNTPDARHDKPERPTRNARSGSNRGRRGHTPDRRGRQQGR